MREALPGKKNHEKCAEVGDDEFFAVDCLSAPCVAEETEPDLADNHAQTEGALHDIAVCRRNGGVFILIVQVAEDGNN
jgi:hypothetical protein